MWFEEALLAGTLATAEAAARSCATLLVVGTSAEVYPVAGLPMVARACGAVIVEINPNATPLSDDADYVLRGPAAAILPALLTAAWPDAGR